VEYQYNRLSQTVRKREYIDNQAVSKALQEVQAGQTEQSLYESFVELAAALQGMGEANLELNEQLSELNEQQKRVDDLLVALNELSQGIAQSETESVRLDKELGTSTAKLVNLQGQVQDEVVRYNRLKSTVEGLSAKVREYEIKLGLIPVPALMTTSLFAARSMEAHNTSMIMPLESAAMSAAEATQTETDTRISDSVVEAVLFDLDETRSQLETLYQDIASQKTDIFAQASIVAQSNQRLEAARALKDSRATTLGSARVALEQGKDRANTSEAEQTRLQQIYNNAIMVQSVVDSKVQQALLAEVNAASVLVEAEQMWQLSLTDKATATSALAQLNLSLEMAQQAYEKAGLAIADAQSQINLEEPLLAEAITRQKAAAELIVSLKAQQEITTEMLASADQELAQARVIFEAAQKEHETHQQLLTLASEAKVTSDVLLQQAESNLTQSSQALEIATTEQTLALQQFNAAAAELAPYLEEQSQLIVIRDKAQVKFDEAFKAVVVAEQDHDAAKAAKALAAENAVVALKAYEKAEVALAEGIREGLSAEDIRYLTLARNTTINTRNTTAHALENAQAIEQQLLEKAVQLQAPREDAKATLAQEQAVLDAAIARAANTQQDRDNAYTRLNQANTELDTAILTRQSAEKRYDDALAKTEQNGEAQIAAEQALVAAEAALQVANDTLTTEYTAQQQALASQYQIAEQLAAANAEQKQASTAKTDVEKSLALASNTLAKSQEVLAESVADVSRLSAQRVDAQDRLTEVMIASQSAGALLSQARFEGADTKANRAAAEQALADSEIALAFAEKAFNRAQVDTANAHADVIVATAAYDMVDAAYQQALQAETLAAQNLGTENTELTGLNVALATTTEDLDNYTQQLAEQESLLADVVSEYGGLSGYQAWKARQQASYEAQFGDPAVELKLTEIDLLKSQLDDLSQDIQIQQQAVTTQNALLQQEIDKHQVAKSARESAATAVIKRLQHLQAAQTELDARQQLLDKLNTDWSQARDALTQAEYLQREMAADYQQKTQARISAQQDYAGLQSDAVNLSKQLEALAAAIERAQLQLAQTQSGLTRAEAAVTNNAFAISEAEARLAAATDEVTRLTQLRDGALAANIVATQALTDAETALLQANHAFAQSEANDSASAEQLLAAQARFSNATAALTSAKTLAQQAIATQSAAQQELDQAEAALAPHLAEITREEALRDEAQLSFGDADTAYKTAVVLFTDASDYAVQVEKRVSDTLVALNDAQQALDTAIVEGKPEAEVHTLSLHRDVMQERHNQATSELDAALHERDILEQEMLRLSLPRAAAEEALNVAQQRVDDAILASAPTQQAYDFASAALAQANNELFAAQASLAAAIAEEASAITALTDAESAREGAASALIQAAEHQLQAVSAHDQQALLAEQSAQSLAASQQQLDAEKSTLKTAQDELAAVNNETLALNEQVTTLQAASQSQALALASLQGEQTAAIEHQVVLGLAITAAEQTIITRQQAEADSYGLSQQADSQFAQATQTLEMVISERTSLADATSQAQNAVNQADAQYQGGLVVKAQAITDEARASEGEQQARQTLTTLNGLLEASNIILTTQVEALAQKETALELAAAPYGGLTSYQNWKANQAAGNATPVGDPDIEIILAKIGVAEQRLAELSTDIETQQAELSNQQVFLQQKQQEFNSARALREQKADRLAAVNGQLSQADQLLRAREQTLAEMDGAYQLAKQQADAANAALNAAQQRSEEADEARAQALADISARRIEKDQAGQALAQLIAALQTAQTQLAQEKEDVANAAISSESQQALLNETSTKLAQYHSQIEQLLQQQTEAKNALEQADRELATAQSSHALTSEEAEQLAGELNAANEAKQATDTAKEQANIQLATALQQLEAATSDLSLAEQVFTAAETALAPYLAEQAPLQQAQTGTKAAYETAVAAVVEANTRYQAAVIATEHASQQTEDAEVALTLAQTALDEAIANGEAAKWYALTVARDAAINTRNTTANQLKEQTAERNRLQEMAQELLTPEAETLAAWQAAEASLNAVLVKAESAQLTFNAAKAELALAEGAHSVAMTQHSSTLDEASQLNSEAQQAAVAAESAQQAYQLASTNLAETEATLATVTSSQGQAFELLTNVNTQLAEAQAQQGQAELDEAQYQQGLQNAQRALIEASTRADQLTNQIAQLTLNKQAAETGRNNATTAFTQAQQALEALRTEQAYAAADLIQAQQQLSLASDTLATAAGNQKLAQQATGTAIAQHGEALSAQLTAADELAQAQEVEIRSEALLAQARSSVNSLQTRLTNASEQMAELVAELAQKEAELAQVLVPYGGMVGYEAWKKIQSGGSNAQFGDPNIEKVLAEISVIKNVLIELEGNIAEQGLTLTEQQTFLAQKSREYESAAHVQSVAQQAYDAAEAALSLANETLQNSEQTQVEQLVASQQSVEAKVAAEAALNEANSLQQQAQQVLSVAVTLASQLTTEKEQAEVHLAQVNSQLVGAETRYQQLFDEVMAAEATLNQSEAVLAEARIALANAEASLAQFKGEQEAADLALARATSAATEADAALDLAVQQFEQASAGVYLAETEHNLALAEQTTANQALVDANALLALAQTAQADATVALQSSEQALAPYQAEINKQTELRDSAQANYDLAAAEYDAADAPYQQAIVDVETAAQAAADASKALEDVEIALADAVAAGDHGAIYALTVARNNAVTAKQQAQNELNDAVDLRDTLQQDIIRLGPPKTAAAEVLAIAQARVNDALANAAPIQEQLANNLQALTTANEQLTQATQAKKVADSVLTAINEQVTLTAFALTQAQQRLTASQQTELQAEVTASQKQVEQTAAAERVASLLAHIDAAETAKQTAVANIEQLTAQLAAVQSSLEAVTNPVQARSMLMAAVASDPVATAEQALADARAALTAAAEERDAQQVNVANQRVEQENAQTAANEVTTQLNTVKQTGSEAASQLEKTEASKADAQQALTIAETDYQQKVAAVTQAEQALANARVDQLLAENAFNSSSMTLSNASDETSAAQIARDQAASTVDSLNQRLSASIDAHKVVDASLAPKEVRLDELLIPYQDFSGYLSSKGEEIVAHAQKQHGEADNTIVEKEALVSALVSKTEQLEKDIAEQKGIIGEQERLWGTNKSAHEVEFNKLNDLMGEKTSLDSELVSLTKSTATDGTLTVARDIAKDAQSAAILEHQNKAGKAGLAQQAVEDAEINYKNSPQHAVKVAREADIKNLNEKITAVNNNLNDLPRQQAAIASFLRTLSLSDTSQNERGMSGLVWSDEHKETLMMKVDLAFISRMDPSSGELSHFKTQLEAFSRESYNVEEKHKSDWLETKDWDGLPGNQQGMTEQQKNELRAAQQARIARLYASWEDAKSTREHIDRLVTHINFHGTLPSEFSAENLKSRMYSRNGYYLNLEQQLSARVTSLNNLLEGKDGRWDEYHSTVAARDAASYQHQLIPQLRELANRAYSELTDYTYIETRRAELLQEKQGYLNEIQSAQQAIKNADDKLKIAEQAVKDAKEHLGIANKAMQDAFDTLISANKNMDDAKDALSSAQARLNEVESNLIPNIIIEIGKAEIDEANALEPITKARELITTAEGILTTAKSELDDSNGKLDEARHDLAVAYELREEVSVQLKLARSYFFEAKDKVGDAQKAVGNAAEKLSQDLRINTVSYDTDYKYDARGQLKRTLSAAVTYNEHSEVGDVITRYGRMETVNQYDSLGNVIAITTAAGTQVENTQTFNYTVSGQQTDSTGLAGSQVVYDEHNQPVVNYNSEGERRDRVYDKEGQLRYEVDELGYVTEHRYNGFGEKVTQLRYGNVLNVTRHHNTALKLSEIEAFTVHGGEVRTLTFDYNKQGLKTDTIQSSVRPSKAERVTDILAYNAFGEVVNTRRTYDTGVNWSSLSEQESIALASHIYDASGNLLASRDGENYITVYSYNKFGELAKKSEYKERYTGSWDLASINSWRASNDAQEDSYQYDNRGNRNQVTRHNVKYAMHTDTGVTTVINDLVSTMYYDLANRNYYTVTEAGAADPSTHGTNANAVINEYDALGRLVSSWGKERDYLVANAILATPSERKIVQPDRLSGRQRTDYSYDAHGNQISIRSEGRVTYQYYDAEGRLTGRRDAEGNYVAIETDAMNRITSERQLVSVGGELSYRYERVTEYKYDATGRQTETWVYGDKGIRKEEAVYNAFGEIERKLSNDTLQEQFEYNGFGQVTAADKKGVSYLYDYDSLGNVTRETIGNARTLVRDYDNLGRLKTEQGIAFEINATAAEVWVPLTSMEYDRWGNMKYQTVNGVTTHYGYDGNNNVIEQRGPSVVYYRENGEAARGEVQTNFYYDASGNHIGTKLKNGALHRSFYDASGQKLRDLSGSGAEKHYYHNARGDLIATISADGKGEQFYYNNNGQLESRARV
ncbi:hypothetical protein K6Y31_21315, partial [Motilimonas cestriensis]